MFLQCEVKYSSQWGCSAFLHMDGSINVASIQDLWSYPKTTFVYLCLSTVKSCTTSQICRLPMVTEHYYTNNEHDFKGTVKSRLLAYDWSVLSFSEYDWIPRRQLSDESGCTGHESYTGVKTWVKSCVFPALCAHCVICSFFSSLSGFSEHTGNYPVYKHWAFSCALRKAIGVKAKVSCRCYQLCLTVISVSGLQEFTEPCSAWMNWMNELLPTNILLRLREIDI